MTLRRKVVGEPMTYKGHSIEARHVGPDLICCVDGTEVGHFYLDAEAARKAGCKYVDQIEKEKAT